MEGVPVVAVLCDSRQVGQCGCATLVSSEPLQSLLHFRGVVVLHLFTGTVVRYIGRYVFSLVEGAGGKMVAPAVRVENIFFVVSGGGELQLMADFLGELETGNLFHITLPENRKYL
jgi:hypothetical protein